MKGKRMGMAKFPTARIKKIMQVDDDVGKVASSSPIIISKALELFLEDILVDTAKVTREQGGKKIMPYHLKNVIEHTQQYDFLVDLVEGIKDPMAGLAAGGGAGPSGKGAGRGKAPASSGGGAGKGGGAGARNGKAKAEAQDDALSQREAEATGARIPSDRAEEIAPPKGESRQPPPQQPKHDPYGIYGDEEEEESDSDDDYDD